MKRFLLLWLLVITAILSSCEKRWTTNEPSPSPEPTAQNEKSEKAFEKSSSDEEIKMKSNVINVKKDINQFLIKVDPDKNKIEYKYNTILDQIKEGDVLYSSGVHTLDEAYAIKVKKIVRDGDKLIIETEPAETKDVFTEFQQKGEFVFNQKGETEIFDVEAQLNDISSDTRSINEGGLRSLAIKRIPKNKEKDRGNISYKDGDAVISYPLFDKDGNYKTKEDQILLSLKVKHKKNPFHSMTYSLKDAYFSMIGQMEFEYHVDLTYGFEIKKDSTISLFDNTDTNSKEDHLSKNFKKVKDFKEWLNKQTIFLMKSDKKKKNDSKLAEALGKIVNKKILLASLPLKLKSPSDLLVEPRLYIFFEMSYSIDGKVWIHFEYKPVVIDYRIELSLFTQNIFDVGLSSIRPPSFQNFEINGNLKGEAKAGVKAMLSLDFLPAIKDKEEEKIPSNHIGLYADLYTKGSISIDAKLKKENMSLSPSTRSNDDWTGHLLADLNLGAYLSTGLEVRAKLFDHSFEYDKEFHDPVNLLPFNLQVKSGYIKLDGGSTYKLKDEDGEPAFWKDKSLRHRFSNPEIAGYTYDEKEKELIIHGYKEGKSWLFSDFQDNLFRFASLYINVGKSKSQIDSNIDISKGEEL